MRQRPIYFGNDQCLSRARGVLVEEFAQRPRMLGFALGALLIIVVGPFGTFSLPLATRAGYWFSWFALVWVATTALFVLVQSHPRFRQGNALLASLISMVASIPVAALLCLALATQFFPSLVIGWATFLAEARFLSPIVAAITCILHMTRPSAPTPVIASGNGCAERFFKRLPPELGRKIISISVSDHYLQVRTQNGEALIHGSLSEAIGQLDDYPGCQIHRSHWVACSAIEDRKWTDHRLQLRLKSGRTLPVGRSYRTRLLELLRE